MSNIKHAHKALPARTLTNRPTPSTCSMRSTWFTIPSKPCRDTLCVSSNLEVSYATFDCPDARKHLRGEL